MYIQGWCVSFFKVQSNLKVMNRGAMINLKVMIILLLATLYFSF